MAEVTRNLALSNYAYIQEDSPNTHVTPNTSTWYAIYGGSGGDSEMLFTLAAWPASLKRKKLIDASLTVQIEQRNYPVLGVKACEAGYNAATVTWNTAPNRRSESCLSFSGGSGAGGDVTLHAAGSPAAAAVGKLLRAKALCFTSNQFSPRMKTVLSNGTALKVVASYDDAVTVPSRIYFLGGPEGTVDAKSVPFIGWLLETDTDVGYCVDDTWTQASAKIYWKKSTASSWSVITDSSSLEGYSIPANVLPTGASILYFVEVTDTEGNTSSTDVYTFDTYATQVTPITYPTGNSVDNRVAQAFSWDFVSASGATGYKQGSAIIYWRVSGAGTWNQISISGTTKSKSVAAYTFPANSTIEWYIRGTDYSGAVSTSQTYSFKTLAYTLAISSAPTGSNIDTRNAITFSWTISNAQGAVTQSSAIFYWRVSGASSYTAVNISGGTKSVSIPANTFPTGKAIQWYVKVTAADGTVLQSSAATFNTVTTKITADTYPSGSGVYTASTLRWTWHFQSNVGNYSQASAKLYWRVSTQQSYTAINVSGSTQSLTVPANTFPTGKTIQWYLEGTDVGGLTTTTSVMSFTTVTTQITPQASPTSGYTDPRYAIVFQWYFASTGGAVPQGSASFFWRETGASTWNEVPASGAQTKVTIPANTFPVATTIDWYISGTDIGGTSSTSEVYTISTTASTAYAYPQAPIGVTTDTSKPVTMRWILQNADGTSPKKVTLSWKRPTDISWTVIQQSATPFTEWTVAAGFFPVGEIEWKVVATNRDDIDGPAGTAAFISVRAPDAPVGLSAAAVPRTTISWQGADQEAYEILIDGETVRQAYGADTSWQPDFVLDDGTHVIAVRIQGPYGFWSDPAVTTVAIANAVPAGWEDLALSGKFDVDAVLAMSGAESLTNPTVNWFRDGKRIAVTTGLRAYTDRFVLGEHSYFVEIWNSDGNYARSNTVRGSMVSCITRIALFSGGDWIDLKYSDHSDKEQNFSYSRTAAARHVLGAAYPVLEMSGFEDVSGAYDCAFPDVGSAARFEALRGKLVILKSRGGNVLIGALTNLSKRYTDFYISYAFGITAIDWEDFRYVSAND